MREDDAELEALREAIEAFASERAPELVAEAKAEAAARVRTMLAEAIASSLLDHSAASLGPDRAGPRPQGASRRPATRGRPRRPTRASRPAPGARRARPTPRTATAAAAKPDPGEPVPERSGEAPRGDQGPPPVGEGPLGYYVYGVVSAGGADLPADLPGVDSRHAATLLAHGGLAAISSRVSLAEFGEEQLRENLNDVAWLEDKARAHEEVLDAALGRMTVVPMRLCTIYRGEEQVREMLESERDVLLDALDRLAGRTEWGVKLIAEPGALERAVAGAPDGEGDAGGGVSEGAAYLDRKRREVRARDEEDRVAGEWADAVHERLAAKAAEALLNPLQRPEVSGHRGDMLLNGVYLVEDRRADDFRGAVDELAEAYRPLGAAVELTGPWPPYNFVKSSIEAAR